jgi:hypothetical protein
LATDAQTSFTDVVKQTTSHVVDSTMKAADEAKKFEEPKKKVG